jgi:hypothetical protein
MIKVFTSNHEPASAGNHLTQQFESWRATFTRGIEVIAVHTNSNKYGWMMAVTYKCN